MTELLEYNPPQQVLEILEGHNTPHRIMSEGETPQALLNRVTETIFSVESKFKTPEEEVELLKDRFKAHFIARDFIPGVPTLTNAGRPGYENSALSSCVVIPVDLRNKEEAIGKILAYYDQNMGSGFNLTRYEDPVAILRWLNDLSVSETLSTRHDRRIANMGTLHVTHPKIREFIQAKVDDRSLIHFNTSVQVNDVFMEAASLNKLFELVDGSLVDAYELLKEIATASWKCGDPGLINLDRMNDDNPLAAISAYDCSPPCGEMGLAPGETCQFGYINLANFVDNDGIKAEKLGDLVKFMVRVLDNAIEYGINNQPSPEGQQMAKLKRKIGISVAGLADALIKVGLPYDSDEGRQLAKDMLSLINYQAKIASVELGQERGSCEAMNLGLENSYFSGYISERFAGQPTNTVSIEQWKELDERIAESGHLRNIHHTALPPAGRTSIILGVNHSIEPLFSPTDLSVETIGRILELIGESIIESETETDIQRLFNKAIEQGTFQNLPITNHAKRLLLTAIEINPRDHVLMASILAGSNGVTDESVSKTVNFPIETTPDEVLEIYLFAHEVGMKNISVYRDASLDDQPRVLS